LEINKSSVIGSEELNFFFLVNLRDWNMYGFVVVVIPNRKYEVQAVSGVKIGPRI
jgi:hypothetical protein